MAILPRFDIKSCDSGFAMILDFFTTFPPLCQHVAAVFIIKKSKIWNAIANNKLPQDLHKQIQIQI